MVIFCLSLPTVKTFTSPASSPPVYHFPPLPLLPSSIILQFGPHSDASHCLATRRTLLSQGPRPNPCSLIFDLASPPCGAPACVDPWYRHTVHLSSTLLINSTKVSLVHTFRSSEALCPRLSSTPLPPASPFPFILHLSRFICPFPCFPPEPWYIPTITDLFVVPCNSCAVLPHSEFCF